jgi:hypothetical protein
MVGVKWREILRFQVFPMICSGLDLTQKCSPIRTMVLLDGLEFKKNKNTWLDSRFRAVVWLVKENMASGPSLRLPSCKTRESFKNEILKQVYQLYQHKLTFLTLGIVGVACGTSKRLVTQAKLEKVMPTTWPRPTWPSRATMAACNYSFLRFPLLDTEKP